VLNLLELKPQRCKEWERAAENGFAVILIPRFQGAILGKILQPRLKRPFFKINLDEFGTAVWECCDGNTTVAKIAELLRQKFGADIEPVQDRLGLFIRQLDEGRLVRFTNL
jgi:hypothetical protein